MDQLIKITKNSENKETVSARELYQFLDLAQSQFKRWSEKNIVKNTFAVENEDYKGFDIMSNGNKTKDFSITIDFAKRLSMMARTEKGEQARQYFIECEKKLKETSAYQIPQNFTEALKLAYEQQLVIDEQTKKIEKDKPKVDFYDDVTGSTDTIDMGSVAKTLNIKGYGRNNLFQFLRDKNILMQNNQPYQTYIDRGYFRIVESSFTKPDGTTHISLKTVVYQKGLAFIRRQIEKEI